VSGGPFDGKGAIKIEGKKKVGLSTKRGKEGDVPRETKSTSVQTESKGMMKEELHRALRRQKSTARI